MNFKKRGEQNKDFVNHARGCSVRRKCKAVQCFVCVNCCHDLCLSRRQGNIRELKHVGRQHDDDGNQYNESMKRNK